MIPAYNEAAFLGRTLASLASQDFPGRVEVIVVDNNSTDATTEIARAYGATVLSETRRGVCHARQRGTQAATGEIVLSTDADTVHPIDWLSRIDASFRTNEDCVAVAGPCRFDGASWWVRAYPLLLFGAVHLVYGATRRVCYASATNIAFHRSAFTGYDTHLDQGGDELGLLRRLRRQGRIVFDRSNVVTTSARRLRRGLLYSLLVTFFFYYVCGYLVNRIASRSLMPLAPAIRDRDRPHRRLAWMVGLPIMIGCLLVWAV